MSSRCRQFAINKSNPLYVPVYTPVSCPDPVNNDPKRNEAYCAPALCRSEPLSHSEYLRKLKANNGRAVSSAANLLQVGSGRYTTTIWTTSEAAGSCCNGNDSVLPAVPAVHPGGHALDSGHLTEMRGANAARGTVSKFDSVNKTEDITMLRRKGLAIAADNSFGAPAGSTRTTCDVCSLSGTTTVDPGTGCGCSS